MRDRFSNSARLRLEPLEGREVPAGAVTASLSHGKLTITGDDQPNALTLQVGAGSVVLTPDATTSVNGLAPGTILVMSGTATSLSARLGGSSDILSIDGSSDFVLTGAAAIDLGSGTNTLNLTTTGHITLGGLAVTSGDASNSVTVSAGPGLGTVNGPASFAFGAGGLNSLNLNEMKFLGPTGVKVTAGKGGVNSVQSTNVAVAKTLSINAGNSPGSLLTFTGDTLGGLALTGTATNFNLTSTTINGNLSANASFSASGGANNVAITGDVTLKGGFQAALSTSGGFTARNVSISSPTIAVFQGAGTSATVNGNLSVTGSQSQIGFATSALSEVKGNVAVRGGSLFTLFQTNGNFKADRDVSVTSGDGFHSVTIGDTTAAAAILGNLTIKTGDGLGAVGLTDLTVGKATRITTGAGAETLTIDGSTFQGAFTANLGGGDDTISIAQRTGLVTAVTFAGKATINAGSGSDTLLLGRSGTAGGDAHTQAVFGVPTSRIDGGTGFNTFDGLTPGQSPSQYTGLTAANFLHWTDPTP